MSNLKQYFIDYSRHSMSGDVEALAKFYADTFMVATLTESSTFKNDVSFIDWLNEVYEFNKQNGLIGMAVLNVASEKFGGNFVRATVTWSARYSKKPDKAIEFDLHYILNTTGARPLILMYLSEQDQEQLMKDSGVL